MTHTLPPHPSSRRACASSRAFTLAELLVVIGIIGVLLAILLPVVNKVKAQGWRADSLNQINILRSAVDAYQLSFNAYPGAFSNDQIESHTVPNITAAPTGTSEATNPSVVGAAVTMSENLVISLAGGVRLDESGNLVFALHPSTATLPPLGKGPSNLTTRNPKLYAPFLDNTLAQTSARAEGKSYTGTFREAETGRITGTDSEIPEFIDRFPNNPLPVLYYRARAGRVGTDQYSYLQNDAYVKVNPPIGPTPRLDGTVLQHGLQEQGGYAESLVPFPLTAKNPRGNKLLPYLRNPTVSVTGSPNSYQPRGKDTYVLISPGADRIYGTNDDLTSFGSVE